MNAWTSPIGQKTELYPHPLSLAHCLPVHTSKLHLRGGCGMKLNVLMEKGGLKLSLASHSGHKLQLRGVNKQTITTPQHSHWKVRFLGNKL